LHEARRVLSSEVLALKGAWTGETKSLLSQKWLESLRCRWYTCVVACHRGHQLSKMAGVLIMKVLVTLNMGEPKPRDSNRWILRDNRMIILGEIQM
jgi:hypothetical protein